MKKLYLIIAVLLLVVTGQLTWLKLSADASFRHYDPTQLTEIEIGQSTLLLGDVRYDEKKQATFEIKNNGANPLIIKAVQPSCGCTNVKWNKHPVKPGEKTKISITFEPNSLGKFNKSIDLFCNTSQNLYKLNFSGQVIE